MKVNAFSPLLDGYALQVIHSTTDEKVNNMSNRIIKPKRLTELILPWPDKALSPNARVHWAKRAQAVKAARHEAFMLARHAGWTKDYLSAIKPDSIDYLTLRYDLHSDFYPPNRYRRDDDNLIAAFKPYRDGIAQALNVDDFRFRTIATVHQNVMKGGQVKVRMT